MIEFLALTAYSHKIMSLKTNPELHSFLSTYFSEADAEADEASVQSFLQSAPPARAQTVLRQLKAYATSGEISIEDLGIETNRWFSDAEEAQAWLESLARHLNSKSGETDGGSDSVIVKDSNGAVLGEGDSVTAIKDLKVKGGSSDLKRGTLVRNIHLTGEPAIFEAKVNGTTLVLKSEYFKKA